MIKALNNKKTLKSAFWILTSNVILAISNWGQLALMTKKLDLYLLGVYTLSLAISTPVFQFLNLQLRVLYVSNRDSKFNFIHFFSLRIAASILILAIAIASGFYVFDAFLDIKIYVLVYVLYIVDGIIDMFNAKLHYDERMTEVSYSTIIRAVLGFSGFILGILVFDSITIALVLGISFKMLGFLFFDYRLYRKGNNHIECKFDRQIINLAKWSFPMGIGLLISSLNVNISRYFINYRFGIEIQGVYSTLSYLVVIGNMFIGTFGNVILPKLAINYAARDFKKMKSINNIFLLFTFFTGFLLFVISWAYSDFFIGYVFSDKIAAYASLLGWIMGSAIFSYLTSAVGFTLTAANFIRQQAYMGIITLVINLGLNLIFFHTSTLQTITLFVGISFFVQFLVGMYLFYNKLYKLQHLKITNE